ncbi:unnamed protein product, partial [Tenebrio molitor]
NETRSSCPIGGGIRVQLARQDGRVVTLVVKRSTTIKKRLVIILIVVEFDKCNNKEEVLVLQLLNLLE